MELKTPMTPMNFHRYVVIELVENLSPELRRAAECLKKMRRNLVAWDYDAWKIVHDASLRLYYEQPSNDLADALDMAELG